MLSEPNLRVVLVLDTDLVRNGSHVGLERVDMNERGADNGDVGGSQAEINSDGLGRHDWFE